MHFSGDLRLLNLFVYITNKFHTKKEMSKIINTLDETQRKISTEIGRNRKEGENRRNTNT